MHALMLKRKVRSQPLSTFHIIAIWKKKKKKREKWNGIKPCEMSLRVGGGGSREAGFLFGVVAGLTDPGSGLLATPLALYRPPEELLYMPRHVHGVVQVEVSISVQHRVTPVTGHRAEPDRTAHHQHSSRNETRLYSRENAHTHTLIQSSSCVQKDLLTHIGGYML